MNGLVRRGVACALIMALAGSWAAAASAELGALPERTDVAGSRPLPEYAPLAVRLGGWTAAPEVSINQGHDSNIYGLSQDAVSDGYVVVSPSFRLNSDWGRHEIGLSARSALTRYYHHPVQNSTEYGVDAHARLDLVPATMTLSSSWNRIVERRGTNGIAPTRDRPSTMYSSIQSIDLTRDIGRIGVSASASHQTQTFSDIVRLDGTILPQDFRDARIWTAEMGVGFLPRPDTALNLAIRYVRHDAASVPGRNSSGLAIHGGAAVDMGLFRASLSLGYLDQRFSSPQFRDFKGFTFKQTTYWYVTTLMTIRVGIDRSLQNSGDPAAGAVVATSVRAGLDYELLRNFLIHAEIGRTRQGFRDIDRTLVSRSWALNGEYSFNRSVAIGAYARRECRDSAGVAVGRQYCASLVGMTLKFRR
jgi:hypothetical protein